MQARRDAARDRAEQAAGVRRPHRARTAENAAFAADMRRKIAEREEAIDVPRGALTTAQRTPPSRPSSSTRRPVAPTSPSAGRDEPPSGCDDAEDRAAEAIVLVAELEAELDVLRAELELAPRGRGPPPPRRAPSDPPAPRAVSVRRRAEQSDRS